MTKLKLLLIALLVGFSCGNIWAAPTKKVPAEWDNSKFTVEDVEGYSRAVLRWTCPTLYSNDKGTAVLKGFRIYRDGEEIDRFVTVPKYVDKALDPGTYRYKLAAIVYPSATIGLPENPDDPDKNGEYIIYSEEKEITISERNGAKIVYRINEIYNYGIGDADDSGVTTPNDFIHNTTLHSRMTEGDIWRNAYYKFISNATTRTDHPEEYDGNKLNANGNELKGGLGRWFFFDMANNRILYCNAGMMMPKAGGKLSSKGSNLSDESIGAWKVYTYVPNNNSPYVNDYGLYLKGQRYPQAVGFAIDHAGNILIRYGSAGFYTTPTLGVIIPYNDRVGASGSVEDANKKIENKNWPTFNFPTANLNNFCDYTAEQYPQRGRCDYFTVTGNLCANDGQGAHDDVQAYVYYSPGYSRVACRTRIRPKDADGKTVYSTKKAPDMTKGVAVNHQYIRVPYETSYTTPSGKTRKGSIDKSAANVENYVFPVDGVNHSAIALLRSSGYFQVSGMSNRTGYNSYNLWGDETKIDDKNRNIVPILSGGLGEVNQAGGATLYFKGKHANGLYVHSMLLCTSVSKNSDTEGGFQLIIAGHKKDQEFMQGSAEDFEFGDLRPCQIYNQKMPPGDGSAANSNSNFLYMEKRYEKKTDGYRFFIHQYAPKTRVACYEIIPFLEQPNANVSIHSELDYDYNHPAGEEYKSDIVGLINHLTWNSTDFDGNDDGHYKVNKYEIDIITPDGETIHVSADARTDENGEYSYTITYPEGKGPDGQTVVTGKGKTNVGPDKYVDYFEVPFDWDILGTYQANVVTKYTPEGWDMPYESEPAESDVVLDYPVLPPTVTAQLWKGEDGSSVEGKYRVDIQFEHNNDPTDETSEPVSYYELLIDKHDGNGPHKEYVTFGKSVTENPDYKEGDDCCSKYIVTDQKPETASFYYLTSDPTTEKKVNCTDVCAFQSSEEYEEYLNNQDGQKTQIPGTADHQDRHFATPDAEEEGGVPSNLSFYPDVKDGEDPTTWDFYIQPVYASGTTFEKKTQGKATSTFGGTTGVGSIEAEKVKALEIYPNPAVDVVTVSATSEIQSIDIFTTAGALVKSMQFGGNTTTEEINVEGLSSGAYILNVNAKHSTPLIKK